MLRVKNMNEKNKILLNVNKIYNEQNPSNYYKSISRKTIDNIFEIKKKFLIEKLKLPPKVFKNSELLDLGCGTGQNTINYDWKGARCTLVEYDKKSYIQAQNLFRKYAKNKFRIINRDIFKFKTKKKFDFVVLNGVAHHTSDVAGNINLAIKFLKKDGILILGIGELAGFFQRNLQRYILYSLTSDISEITKLSKLLFKENLLRGKKYGGRSVKEIIYDTYINPKIKTLSFKDIQNLFNKNKLYLYSSDEENIDFKTIHGFSKSYFRLIKKKKFNNKEFLFNSIVNFSYSGKPEDSLDKNLKILDQISNIQYNISKKIDDQSIERYKKLNFDKSLSNLKNKISKLQKIDIINTKNHIKFISEVQNIFIILKDKNKKNKIKKLQIAIKKYDRLFRVYNGKGMNYFVGIKLQ